MNTSIEQLACTRIIGRLAAAGPHVAQEFMPDVLEQVSWKYPPADEEKLDGILRNPGGFNTYSARAFVYGPLIDRNTPALWPVMAFSAGYRFTNFRIRLALFFDPSPEEEEKHKAVAWRYEPPEGDTGAHCYYHSQPISSWDNNESGRLPVARPLNESHPAFPLMADDAPGLLVAMMVSLYGHESTKKFLGASTLRRDVLLVKSSLSKLRLWDS